MPTPCRSSSGRDTNGWRTHRVVTTLVISNVEIQPTFDIKVLKECELLVSYPGTLSATSGELWFSACGAESISAATSCQTEFGFMLCKSHDTRARNND